MAFEYPSLHGGERSFLAVCGRLRERFELVALAPPDGPLAGALAAAGLPHIGCDVKDPPALHAALAEVRPALLHGNSLSVGRVLGRMKDDPEAPPPCPVTAHLRDILNLSNRATRDLGRCDALVAVSAATRDHHVARGLPAERVAVVHNGIDSGAFLAGVNREGARSSVRDELNVPADGPLILSVGQIGLRKGWDVLAEAAGLVRSEPAPHFLAVGERWSRKDESVRFEADVFAAWNENAPGRVHRLGARTDVSRLLAAADLLAHPARQEPFGRVLLEAAAAGTPIVATAVGGTPEMLGDACAAVPPDDPAALAAALDRLLNDAAERSRLADAARRRADGFTVERSAAGLASVWEGVIEGR
ncbi:Spore coat protein SA [Alienimonas californiensis]|uniref:Spore coat protein SA n=1 Tax=Alienimonas californiensis TaxID=2527989 RepID=A0A517P6T5_9PLAN|nr:Spore coat protein SA [Alienimonas californiensis]